MHGLKSAILAIFQKLANWLDLPCPVSAALQNCPTYFNFQFSIFIFFILFKYETIVKSIAPSFGYSNPNPGSVILVMFKSILNQQMDQASGCICIMTQHSYSISFLPKRCLFHGLGKPNDAFFHRNPKLQGLSRQFGQIIFGALGVFSADLSAPIMVL